jgi:hypothetical protein
MLSQQSGHCLSMRNFNTETQKHGEHSVPQCLSGDVLKSLFLHYWVNKSSLYLGKDQISSSMSSSSLFE